jgi:large subunit ribosomal protein L18e
MKATNPQLLETIRLLKKASNKNDARIWDALAEELSRSKHHRASVNLSHISRSLKEKEIAAVPGKVLGNGRPNKVSIAALSFSETARRKIEREGGECLSFEALIKKSPKGSGVRVIA